MLSQLGVEFHFNVTVDTKKLAEIEASYDAVFLGIGLGAIHKLGIAGEAISGVTNALDYIADYKSGKITSAPERVAVIGAGNTAIDAANAAARLGASEVHMVYRRGPEQMSAFAFEYDHAKQEGVKFLWHVQPAGIAGKAEWKRSSLSKLEATRRRISRPQPGTEFHLQVDLIILAIGQATHSELPAQDKQGETRTRPHPHRPRNRTNLEPEVLRRWRLHQRRPRSGRRRRRRQASRHRDRHMAGGTKCPHLKPPSPASNARIPSGSRPPRPPTAANRSCAPSTQGWGGAVWKTIGEPITNVSSRYSSIDWNGQRMMGLNNIELISDRPIEVNLQRDRRGKATLSEARRHRVTHGRIEA